jgi:hypothetical protein
MLSTIASMDTSQYIVCKSLSLYVVVKTVENNYDNAENRIFLAVQRRSILKSLLE